MVEHNRGDNHRAEEIGEQTLVQRHSGYVQRTGSDKSSPRKAAGGSVRACYKAVASGALWEEPWVMYSKEVAALQPVRVLVAC